MKATSQAMVSSSIRSVGRLGEVGDVVAVEMSNHGNSCRHRYCPSGERGFSGRSHDVATTSIIVGITMAYDIMYSRRFAMTSFLMTKIFSTH
jgi:hypothetical protein